MNFDNPRTVMATLEHIARDLTSRAADAFRLLIQVAQGDVATVSQAYLADRLGVCERHARRLLSQLAERGYIQPQHVYRNNRRRPSRYRLIGADFATRAAARLAQKTAYAASAAARQLANINRQLQRRLYLPAISSRTIDPYYLKEARNKERIATLALKYAPTRQPEISVAEFKERLSNRDSHSPAVAIPKTVQPQRSAQQSLDEFYERLAARKKV